MKNKYLIPILFSLSMTCTVSLYAQTETFDIATFTPPKDFKKESKPGVLIYTHVNKASGGYCVINIYPSTESSGDEQTDFKNAWKELVSTPFNTAAVPQTETNAADGWKAVVGATMVDIGGADTYMILTVFSGFGKTFTVRTSLNEESYVTKVDALFETMVLDKTAKPAATASNPVIQSSGSSGKFGMMMYKSLPGWSEEHYPDGVIFKPKDLPAGEVLILHIMPPLNSSGTIEQAFAQTFNEAAANYKGSKMHAAGGAEYELKEVKKSFKGWVYTRASGGIMIENSTPYASEYGLDIFIIKINNRYERVATLKTRKNCKQSMSRYYPDERPIYRNAMENFFFSMSFTDLPDPGIKPGTIVSEGIQGVWEGISMRAGVSSTSSPAGLSYKVFTPIFLSNGQVYFGTRFPTEGLEGLNSLIRAENTRRDWGTYTFNNGRGVIKMLYGDIPIRMENNKFIITANNTDHAFHKLTPVDGAKFNGTYVMSERYAKIPVITFTADGRFTDNGAIMALYHESDECTNPGLAPGSGTYVVRNHSVIFSFSDGRTISVAFLGTGYDMKNPNPATLVLGFNEDELRKQ